MELTPYSKINEVPGKDFQLPDTHEIIFAWDPPAFGVPDSVWESLREDLREQLFQVVAANGKQHVSLTSQSSPTSGSQPSDSPTMLLQDHHQPRDVLYEREQTAVSSPKS